MIINKEQFKENFKPFDKEVVLEIIDIFINEWPERYQEIRKNINEGDMDSLRFNAHSLKGVIANFLAYEPKEIAKNLEDNGKEKIVNGNEILLERLKENVDELLSELKEIREDYI